MREQVNNIINKKSSIVYIERKKYMKIIGITGKSGSGKSTLAKELTERMQNTTSINVDKIGHKATSDVEISKKLCEVFGEQILNEERKIDRKKLGNIVFSNKNKMDILTEITWGYMQKILDGILEQERENGTKAIILEWALLPIGKYWEMSDTKIYIKANEQERKNKVIQRDQISEEYFLKRDSSGIDYTSYKFDFIFENDYKMETMDNFIENLINKSNNLQVK